MTEFPRLHSCLCSKANHLWAALNSNILFSLCKMCSREVIRLVLFLFLPPWAAAGRRDPALTSPELQPLLTERKWSVSLDSDSPVDSFSSKISTWHGHGIRRDQLQPNFQGPPKCSCGQSAGWWQADSQARSPFPRQRKQKQKYLHVQALVLFISPAVVQDWIVLPEQFAIIWSLVTFSACTYSLSAGLWICHSTAEISAVIFWSRDVQQWTIPQWLKKQSHCCCLPPLNTSERHPKTSAASSEWSTGCFGIQQERFHWTDFGSNMVTTVIKPLEKYLVLLGTVVSAVLNYLYTLKNILECSSVA